MSDPFRDTLPGGPIPLPGEPETSRALAATMGVKGDEWDRILRALGFRPSDLHASNLMRRLDGSFAVSDFGLSLWDRFRPPASRDIRRLQNPRRRR